MTASIICLRITFPIMIAFKIINNKIIKIIFLKLENNTSFPILLSKYISIIHERMVCNTIMCLSCISYNLHKKIQQYRKKKIMFRIILSIEFLLYTIFINYDSKDRNRKINIIPLFLISIIIFFLTINKFIEKFFWGFNVSIPKIIITYINLFLG